jgi:WD40 repeat protein
MLRTSASAFSLPIRHHQQVNILQFDGTGELLASGGADGLLNVWSFKCQAYIVSHQFSDGISAMTWLSYSLRHHSIVVALQGGSVEQLDFSTEDVSVMLSATCYS